MVYTGALAGTAWVTPVASGHGEGRRDREARISQDYIVFLSLLASQSTPAQFPWTELLWAPWLWMYNPVRMLEREGQPEKEPPNPESYHARTGGMRP